MSRRRGDAPRQKGLSFNCPGSYHAPGPAEVNGAPRPEGRGWGRVEVEEASPRFRLRT